MIELGHFPNDAIFFDTMQFIIEVLTSGHVCV